MEIFLNEFIYQCYSGIKSLELLQYDMSITDPICNSIPPNLKQLESFISFKKQTRTWKPECCLCRLCKTYVNDVGFVN